MNMWLSRLRGDLNMKEDIELLAREYRGKEDDPLYAAVMDLIIRANSEAGKEPSKEAEKMCDALKEWIAPQVMLKARMRSDMYPLYWTNQ